MVLPTTMPSDTACAMALRIVAVLNLDICDFHLFTSNLPLVRNSFDEPPVIARTMRCPFCRAVAMAVRTAPGSRLTWLPVNGPAPALSVVALAQRLVGPKGMPDVALARGAEVAGAASVLLVAVGTDSMDVGSVVSVLL